MRRLLLVLFMSAVPVAATAAENNLLASPSASQRASNAPREAEIGAIVGIVPGYLGGQNYMFKGGPYIEINFGNGAFFGQDGIGYRTSSYGSFSFAASLGASRSRFETEGSADTHNRLTGMGDVSPRAQANLFGNYDSGPYHVSALLQRELGNRSGVEFALSGLYDVISSQTDLTQLYAAVDYANQSKMQTFFGVTPSQAASSGNATFKAVAGVAGSGAGVQWRHAFNRDWVSTLDVGAISLRGSAADSPLTSRKTAAYTAVSVGYRF